MSKLGERSLRVMAVAVTFVVTGGIVGCTVADPVLPETAWVHGGPPDGLFEDDPFVQAIRAQEYWQNMAWNTGDFELPEYVRLTRDGVFALDDEATYINTFRGKEDQRGVFIGPRTFLPVAVSPTDTLPGKSAIVTMCTFGDFGNMISADGSGSNLSELAEDAFPENTFKGPQLSSFEVLLHSDGAVEWGSTSDPDGIAGYECDQSLIPIGFYEPRPAHPYAEDD